MSHTKIKLTVTRGPKTDAVTLHGQGGAIGRSETSDLVLDDPKCFISRRHVELDYDEGRFVAIDLSRDGTFLNGVPLRAEEGCELQDGDELVIGDYTIAVSLTAVTAQPADTETGACCVDAPHVEGGANNDLEPTDRGGEPVVNPALGGGVLAADAPSSIEETQSNPRSSGQHPAAPAEPNSPWWHTDSDAHERPRPSIFARRAKPTSKENGRWWTSDPSDAVVSESVMGPQADNTVQHEPADVAALAQQLKQIHQAGASAASAEKGDVAPDPQPVAQSASSMPNGEADFLDVFLLAAELSPQDLPSMSERDLAHMFGVAFSELLRALYGLAQARAAFKGMWGVERTMMQGLNNNPFKVSESFADAKSLLFRNEPGFLDTIAALKELIGDITQHEAALSPAIENALVEFAKSVSPAQLEAKFARQEGPPGGFAFGSKEALNWRKYSDYIAKLIADVEEDKSALRTLFALSYEQQQLRVHTASIGGGGTGE